MLKSLATQGFYATALARVALVGGVTTQVKEEKGDKMLKASIDELTLVLQASREDKLKIEDDSDWIELAEFMISDFEQKAQLKSTFGAKIGANKCPAGYTYGYTYGSHSFYFAVAYNQKAYDMGIIIKFSAEALHYYLRKTGQEAYELLQNVKSSSYMMRLSRIDFDIDFIDEKFTVNALYEQLKSKKVEVYLQKHQKNKVIFSKKQLHFRGFMKNGKIETIYLNSPKSSVNCRIYNKRLEEIELHKPDMNYALMHKWVRFEAIFKGEYAHNLTNTLLNIESKHELSDLIIDSWIQKFYFKKVSKETAIYTQKMIDAKKTGNFVLTGQVPKDNDLAQRFDYLLLKSGTISTLYKIKELWGSSALEYATKYINTYVEDWHENQGCAEWLKKHATDTKESFKDFADFMAGFE